jgi:hypothetical protein
MHRCKLKSMDAKLMSRFSPIFSGFIYLDRIDMEYLWSLEAKNWFGANDTGREKRKYSTPKSIYDFLVKLKLQVFFIKKLI